MNLPRLRSSVALFTLAVLLAQPGDGRAQKPPAPLVPNPLAPTLKQPFPLGMQRGTTLDLTLTGANLADPTALSVSFPAKVTIPTDNNNGKDPTKLLVRLEVPKDAPIGFHTLRLATARGVSNLRLFCIDDLPQVLEENTNHEKDKAQAVTPPCVVVGKADAEMSDYFKVAVKAGQRLSFEVLGRRLGSAFDPQITLYDAKSGKELPGGHNNDAPGLQTDPRLTYTFKDAGDVLIEVRDVSYRGGEDFGYRLRIGDFPCATAPLPMAAKRGTKASVQFAGPTVDGVAAVEVAVPDDPNVDMVWVAPKGANGLYGWPVGLLVSDVEEVMEAEPNNEPAKANRVPVPGGVTGRLLEKGDVDHFVFTAKKGQRYAIDAQTHELGSPTEVYMVLRDAKGAQLAASNPMAASAQINYTAADDGDLTLAVEHLHYWGGPSECYHLHIAPYQPGFDLSLALDRFDLLPGGTLSLPINVARRDYAGAIELSVVGPEGVSGQATIPAGEPKQPNLPGVVLAVKAAPETAPGPHVLRIQGKATIDGKAVVSTVSVRAAVSQSLAGLPVPPRSTYTAIALLVHEKAPYSLALKFEPAEAMPGKTTVLTVTATRAEGFTGEIALTAAGLPAGVMAPLKPIAAGQNEVKVETSLAANVAPGTYPLTLTGKAKHNGREVAAAAAVNLVVKK
jgi:hypothetical protein